MSARPPATYWKTYNSAADWGGGTLTLKSLSGQLHVQALSCGAGDLVATPIDFPPNVAVAPQTLIFAEPETIEAVPASIDPSSTCWPITVWYGPLGRGAR